MHSGRNLWLTMPVLVLLITGCVNLDKRDPAPFRRGQKTDDTQTYASQGDTKKSVAKMQDFAKPTGWTNAVKEAWPFRRKTQMTVSEQPLASDDPTRLDYVPDRVGPELYVASARIAERTGDYEQAMAQYREALKVDRTSRNALIGLARLQHKLGKTGKAIGIYQQALQSHGNDPVILNDLGICFAQEKRLKEAIDALSAASSAAPDREMYANNLAAALVEANRFDEALQHLSRVRSPEVASYNVGFLLAQSGRKEQAADYLRRALFIDPNLQQARKLLDEVAPRIGSMPENRFETHRER